MVMFTPESKPLGMSRWSLTRPAHFFHTAGEHLFNPSIIPKQAETSGAKTGFLDPRVVARSLQHQFPQEREWQRKRAAPVRRVDHGERLRWKQVAQVSGAVGRDDDDGVSIGMASAEVKV
jgi:hypothetical protein